MIPVEKIKTYVYLNKEMHIEFEGFDITITRFTRMADDSAWEIPAHAHMNYELHYIYEGTGVIGLGNNKFDIYEGEFYICPPFIDHSQKTDNIHPMKEYCIECSLDVQMPENTENKHNESFILIQMISRMLYCKHSDRNDVIKRNFLSLNAMLGEHGVLDSRNEIMAKSLMLHTILSMMIFSTMNVGINDVSQNQNNINYQRASSIKNYLEANYKQSITVKDCARIFYLSERQIDRILTKEFNETFHQMLTKTRVNVAIKLMQTTDYSMDMIASESGFTGYRQMLRSFKSHGFTQPARLRKLHK